MLLYLFCLFQLKYIISAYSSEFIIWIQRTFSEDYKAAESKLLRTKTERYKINYSCDPVVVVRRLFDKVPSQVWGLDHGYIYRCFNMLSTVLKYIRRQPTFLLQCRREKKICDNILNWALLKYSLYQSRKVLWLNLRFFTWLYTWRSVTCSISLSISSLEK